MRVIAAAAVLHTMVVVSAIAVLFRGILMLPVERVLDMLGRGPARLAEEGQEDQAPAVEAGHPGDEDSKPEGDGPRDRTAGPGGFDDRIFRPEAGETDPASDVEADAGNRQGADDHHPEGDRDLLPEVAVVTHVLFVVHRV